MEADVETPKYHASDITDKSKREKLLQDNPTALVKFNTFNRRKGEFLFLSKRNNLYSVDKEEHKELNQVQKSRLHRVRFKYSQKIEVEYSFISVFRRFHRFLTSQTTWWTRSFSSLL